MDDLRKYIIKRTVKMLFIFAALWLAVDLFSDIALLIATGEASPSASTEQIEIFDFFGIYYQKLDIATVLIALAGLLLKIAAAIILLRRFASRLSERMEFEKKRQSEEQSEMFNRIAHDLKTPITSISGYSAALVEGIVPEGQKKQEYLRTIHAKSVKMNQLINLLFEYTKLDNTDYRLNLKETDLVEVVRENTALLYSDFEEAGLGLEIELPEAPYFVTADEIELGRAVTNILSNAVQHLETGRTVWVKMQSDSGRIVISDNGRPIPQEIAADIFEPFVSGDESRSSRKGSGLGLAISRKIIEKHGGVVWLEQGDKTPGKAFVIELFSN